MPQRAVPSISGAKGMFSRLYHALRDTEGQRVLLSMTINYELNEWQNFIAYLT